MRKLAFIFILFSVLANGQSLTDMQLLAIQQQAVSGPENLFPSGSAASPVPDESDSTSGWSSGGGASIASVETDQTDGTSTIQITSAGESRGDYSLSLANSTTYDIYFDYKVATLVSGNAGVRTWSGVATSPSYAFTADGSWHTDEMITVTTNSTSQIIRFYASRSGSVTGNVLLIDNIRIYEQ